MKRNVRRALVWLAIFAGAGCGSDARETEKKERGAMPAKAVAAKQAKGAKPGGKEEPHLSSVAKIPEDLRKELNKEDFLADPSGDVNRDPFRSYLAGVARDLAAAPAKGTERIAATDDCKKRLVAEKVALRELKLVGVALRGTQGYAMFADGQQLGHIAHRGDCVSRDRARVREIGADRVMLDVPSGTGAAAQLSPARQEVWRVHPEELPLEDGVPEGGGAAR